MNAAKLQDSITDLARRLFRRHHIPKLVFRKTLPQIVSSGGGMGRIVTRYDQRRRFYAHHFFGLGSGGGVPIEEAASTR